MTRPVAEGDYCLLPPPCAQCGTFGGKPCTGGLRPQRSDGGRHGYGEGALLCRRCVQVLQNRSIYARYAERRNGSRAERETARAREIRAWCDAVESRRELLATLKRLWRGERVPESVLRRVFRRPTKRDERIADLA